MQMTVPRHLKGKGIHEVPLGTPIGRSWLLLFGIIPFDYDKITIAERDHGRRFLEKSTMMSMARWEHERTLEERDGGCLVKDRLTFHLRPPGRWIPGAHRFVAWVLSKLFSHRHRKLQRFFHERKGSQPD
jgi:ligand-binding SRPBCC domain-containing protein